MDSDLGVEVGSRRQQQLTSTISRNLAQLADGIEALVQGTGDADATTTTAGGDEEVLVGLSGQYDRLVDLVHEMGIEGLQVRKITTSTTATLAKSRGTTMSTITGPTMSGGSKVGRLVDAGDDEVDEGGEARAGTNGDDEE